VSKCVIYIISVTFSILSVLHMSHGIFLLWHHNRLIFKKIEIDAQYLLLYIHTVQYISV
jgi:hypothetical protein